MNLYEKIIEVRKVAGGFSKDTKGHNYEYVSGNQILSKIKDKMNEVGVLLIPSSKLGKYSTHEYKDRYGNEKVDFIVEGEMSYTWINAEEPSEQLEVDWAYYGQQNDISKAYGSALTYSERYFLLKCLGLPTDDDDPDGRDTTNKKPAKKNSKKTVGPTPQMKAREGSIKQLVETAEKKGYSKSDIEKVIKKTYGVGFDGLTEQQLLSVMKRLDVAENKKAHENPQEGDRGKESEGEVVEHGENKTPSENGNESYNGDSVMTKGKHQGKKFKDIVKQDRSYAKYVANQFGDKAIRETFRDLLKG